MVEVDKKYIIIAAVLYVISLILVFFIPQGCDTQEPLVCEEKKCPVDVVECDSCEVCDVDKCAKILDCSECLEKPPQEVCKKYYGGGGGSCNNDCAPCETEVCMNCDEVEVIAYTENGKYFCDGIGVDANCVMDETLEMPFD